ncbi:hypothetical protein ABZ470_31635 [Streptosporangium sp. NPDC020072]|uniref:hypothetical protein n=1 Tax=Streptosporangium sp. NPDC020072 TaxID=3154788 RepID=UPI003415BEE7
MSELAEVVTIQNLDGDWEVWINDRRLDATIAEAAVDDEWVDLPAVVVTIPARRVEYVRTAREHVPYGRFDV